MPRQRGEVRAGAGRGSTVRNMPVRAREAPGEALGDLDRRGPLYRRACGSVAIFEGFWAAP